MEAEKTNVDTAKSKLNEVASSFAWMLMSLISTAIFVLIYFAAPRYYASFPNLGFLQQPLFLAAAVASATHVFWFILCAVVKLKLSIFYRIYWATSVVLSVFGIAIQNEALIGMIPTAMLCAMIVKAIASLKIKSITPPKFGPKEEQQTRKQAIQSSILAVLVYVFFGILNVFAWRNLSTDIWVIWRSTYFLIVLIPFVVPNMRANGKNRAAVAVAQNPTSKPDKKQLNLSWLNALDVMSAPLPLVMLVWGYFFADDWISWFPLLAQLGSPLFVAFGLSTLTAFIRRLFQFFAVRSEMDGDTAGQKLAFWMLKTALALTILTLQNEIVLKLAPVISILPRAHLNLIAYFKNDLSLGGELGVFKLLDERRQRLCKLYYSVLYLVLAASYFIVALFLPTSVWIVLNAVDIIVIVFGMMAPVLVFWNSIVTQMIKTKLRNA